MPTKYPVLDPEFRMKMLGCCHDSEQRGLVRIPVQQAEDGLALGVFKPLIVFQYALYTTQNIQYT